VRFELNLCIYITQPCFLPTQCTCVSRTVLAVYSDSFLVFVDSWSDNHVLHFHRTNIYVARSNIRTSFLQQQKHTLCIPLCSAVISRCLAAPRTMETPQLLYCLLVVSLSLYLLLFVVQLRVTTDGLLPISSSWRQVPWDPRPEYLFSNWILTVLVLMEHPHLYIRLVHAMLLRRWSERNFCLLQFCCHVVKICIHGDLIT
jgi:hypothetical protein